MDNELVEAVARAMLVASRPSAHPDDLTPAPRGQLGMMPKWMLYKHLAEAALAATPLASLKAENEALRDWPMGNMVSAAARAIGTLPYPLNEYAIARTALDAARAALTNKDA